MIGLLAAEIGAPSLAAVAGLALGRRLPRSAPLLAVAGTAVAFVVSLIVLAANVSGATVADSGRLFDINIGSLPMAAALRLDGLAAMVAVAVCLVALLVQIYSIAYLSHGPRYPSYAAVVSLFTAAMLLVVHADDLIVLLVGWELMGVCSYLLIGHHWELAGARAAAVKAFLVTRIGDVAFLFGIFVLADAASTFSISGVLAAVERGDISGSDATVATLLLLAGVCGKSAQFPLHTWLPDAMAGPTPVSALIHAATMVAAGVYVVARLYAAFLAAPATLATMAVVSSITMLGAALVALVQDDLKRVLAWSTVSQLAYMVGGLAVGSYQAASFHLLTHAAFKALLFLAAGAVITAVATNSMADMGGLRRAMPVTFLTMTVGLAALSGLPPFSGFFSKEAVLAAAEAAAHGDGPVRPWAGWVVLVVGLLTVAVTAAYVMRLWVMTFLHDRRGEGAAVATAEAPPLMRWPLVVLAVPAALLGFAGLRGEWLPSWLDNRSVGSTDLLRTEPFHIGIGTALASLALIGAGAAGAWFAWRRDPGADPASAMGPARPPLQRAFGLDTAYDRLVVAPTGALARVLRRGDDEVVDAYVRGSGVGARGLGAVLRWAQTGNVQTYLTGLLVGVVVLAVAGAVAA